MRLAARSTPTAAGLLLATVLAACDASPTPPAAPTGPDLLIRAPQWELIALPFSPAAINDAGVIVGTKNGQVVRWENGMLTTLPRLSRLTHAHRAVDITPQGKVLGGTGDGIALLWTSPTQLPRVIEHHDRRLWPVRANDDLTVVGNMDILTPTGPILHHVFRWTPTSGLRDITAPTAPNRVTDLNRYGYASGIVLSAGGLSNKPIRWSPTDSVTFLPTLGAEGVTPAAAEAINDAGDVVGLSAWGTTIWKANGSVAIVIGVPTPRSIVGWNASGRLVGYLADGSSRPWTLHQGALTWLASPDSAAYPVVTGVNNCGSVVAARRDPSAPETGWLWLRPLYACDAPLVANPG